MSTTPRDAHPAAVLFPMLDDSALKELAEDIKANGLQNPIVLWTDSETGKIFTLDGRNREAACAIAGIEPRYQDYTGKDPIAFVIGANLHRRHLSAQDRARIAAELANLKRGANQHTTKEDSSNELSIQQASDLVGVSPASTKRAMTVRDHAIPELKEMEKSGAVSLDDAATVARQSKEEQKKAVAAGPKGVKAKAKQAKASKRSSNKHVPGLSATEKVTLRAPSTESSPPQDPAEQYRRAVQAAKVLLAATSLKTIERFLDLVDDCDLSDVLAELDRQCGRPVKCRTLQSPEPAIDPRQTDIEDGIAEAKAKAVETSAEPPAPQSSVETAEEPPAEPTAATEEQWQEEHAGMDDYTEEPPAEPASTNTERGARLKEERTRLKLSQAQLAKAAEVSQKTISNCEVGKFQITDKVAAGLKTAGIDVHYVMTGER
jgi:DNA-binding XRE family transcriptional regulator/ParB-like chromosome segregation protein Spo0J